MKGTFMRRPALIGFLFTFIFFLTFITCLKTPSNPSENPMNVSVILYYPDEDNTAKAGVPKQLGLEVVLPQHIAEINLSSSCGDADTVIIPSSENKTDTIYFPLVFNNEGTCTLTVTAELVDNRIKEKTDKLVLHVLPGIPALTFSVTPATFITHTGIADTLRFVTSTSRVDNINFTLDSDPVLDSGEMHLIEPVEGDTVSVCFDPSEAGTYAVTLTVTADAFTATASVTVTELSSFTPSETDNPQALMTGTTDTLVFTLTEEQIANGITMELLDENSLPLNIAAVIPSGSDSLLIEVIPAEEGALSFSIVTANSMLTDTTIYTFYLVDDSNAVWTTTAITADAVEGQPCSIELAPYLMEGLSVDGITPTADIGSFNDSGAWYYTPPWGSDATVTAIINGKKGDATQDLTITLAVTRGDTESPIITLLSPATESKTVCSSQTTVSVIVKDTDAGVAEVTFATLSDTVDGTAENDSTWSAVISGLPEGTTTDVIITATDGSMKKNNTTKTISLTYDPTMEDGDAPVFSLIEGPQNGDRVTTASGTITWDISDDSGVDSVWWTLNDEFISAISASGDGEYVISYELSVFGDNTIRLYAKDGSGSANEGSRTITLDYNTEPSAITLNTPVDNATDVRVLPTFEWSGGDDDGDGVTFTVMYGTSQVNLSETATVSGKAAIVSDGLDYNTTYFWQVTGISASADYRDEVQSDVFEFHTEGSLPEISLHPQSQTIEEEQNVTFSVTASGFGTLLYQWRENGTDIVGATGNSHTIPSVTTAMNGNTYDCVVTNEAGEVTSNPATLTVTEIPTYTVTFDLQGGSPAVQAVDVTRGDLVEIPATPSRSAYMFRGWFKDSEGNEQWEFLSDVVTEPVTIYAVWEPIPYSITYNLYGGQNSSNPTTYTIESSISLNDAARTAYVFKGWYTEGSGGTLVTNIPQGSTGAVVLHARWAIEDIDGNTYTEVTIGTQVWMVENLKVTHYNDGTDISLVEEDSEWTGDPAYCWFNNDIGNKEPYGALYNWPVVETGMLAPDGWHVATTAEWSTLINYLGGENVAGGKLKEVGTIHWDSPNGDATNEAGFTALPGSNRIYYGPFGAALGGYGNWWATPTSTGDTRKCFQMNYYDGSIWDNPEVIIQNGYSVRCVRDY